MSPNDIKLLHVESSSKCNAWCPACLRNNLGFGLKDGLIETDLKLSQLRSLIDQLPGLETIQLCGNHGDPIAGNNILPIVDLCIDKKFKLQIHTNGSLRSKAWWSKLGQRLKDIPHEVWFGIDGIGATHEIYRQGTNYNKIIDNATAFIQAGGHAIWQFIPYEHNQKQVLQAMKLSQQLNFKSFKLAKLFRKDRLQVKHWKTGEPFELKVATDFVPLIRMDYKKAPPTKEQCMHLSVPSVYVNSLGHISWCCYRSHEPAESVQELLDKILDLGTKNCIIYCS